ncbi:MAG: capsular biosynthesis protein [Cyclobacteriaceae bacterium]
MLGWLAGKVKPNLQVDIHSHLLPGLDDGVKTMEEAISAIKAMSSLGYKKIVTTPHIYQEFYPNTPSIIMNALAELKAELTKQKIDMIVEAAAEYFLDVDFLVRIKEGAEILSFGEAKYVLFETGFQTKPIILEETVFELFSRGFRPVLAHPERYEYWQPKSELSEHLTEMGVMYQVSLPSIKGFYGPIPRKKAMKLLKLGHVDFLGSDLHRFGQVEGLKKSLQVSIPKTDLLNNSLI